MSKPPQSLIINSPYDMPQQHWEQDRHGRVLQVTEGRRAAGYEIFDTRTNTRRVEELELVNRIRPRVDEWRAANYPGVTSVTRRLLEHWYDREARVLPFYFCQLEAIETLIWWVEAPEEYKQGIYLPGDGGPWERVCSKMATGAGKTTVMGLVIAWQVLNALTYPKRKEFSSAIFIVAPGLTVKERLQVLYPAIEARYNAYTAASGDPWLVLQDPTFTLHKDDFESLYETPPVALKSYLKKLRYGLNGACPMCGRDNLGTLDHYLSKANYPEFSLFSKNLVPACSRCNTQRQTSVKGAVPGERALHPYFDAFATRRLLTIELIPSGIEPRWLAPLIRLVPFGVTPAEAAIVQWQIDNVILPAGFQPYTERIWADFVRAPARYFDRGSDLQSMRASLDFLIGVDESHTDSMNSWRACIYHGIRNCPDALAYLADLLIGPVAPAICTAGP